MTIGQLIIAAKSDEQAKADAVVALQAATVALDSASAQSTASEQALAAGLVVTGPVFVVESDGKASIYASDGAGSYTVTTAKPVETEVGP